MGEQRFQRESERITNFQEIVNRDGSDLIKEVLNKEWFDKIREVFRAFHEKNEKEPLDVIACFAYLWLCVDGCWGSINTGLRKLETFAHERGKENIQNLRKIVCRLKKKDGEGAALEISTLVKFSNDNILGDIEPPFRQKGGHRADALIEIDGRGIIVEVSALTKSIVPLTPQEQRTTITMGVDELVNQVILKIQRKYEQLQFAEGPLILIVSLPPQIGADQQTAKWAFEKIPTDKKSKIGVFVVADTYRFSHGAVHFNEQAEFELTSKERDYVSNLVIPTKQPL
jgi:hypothetical protein